MKKTNATQFILFVIWILHYCINFLHIMIVIKLVPETFFT